MRTMKLTFGLVAAALPVLYCAGLLLHFNGVRNMFGGMLDSQLGPTMLGVGAFGLLFLVLFGLKLWRLFGGTKAPGAGGGGSADPAAEDEKSDFDPDAAIARYLARRSSGAGGGGRPTGPATFGRREV
ncbi:MAG TPA: hypothetical protein VGO55_18605 [Allosphingosinicella sp.]|jgi:hypothetical protein|nr:hypothetical protein [Allosphingosinicella sp.]